MFDLVQADCTPTGGAAVRWRRRRRAVEPLRGDLGWTCEMCGKWRPDEMIAVAQFQSGRWTRNARYCRDREECRAGAVERAEADAVWLSRVTCR